MKGGDKHHYIPVLYLKQWADSDGRVCEFSKPYKTVKPRMTHPDGTGYERGLYSFRNLPASVTDFIEKQFLLQADGKAAQALQRLLDGQAEFNHELRSAWSRFVMTLLHRNPERMDEIRSRVAQHYPEVLEQVRLQYNAMRTPNSPETFEEFERDLKDGHLQYLTMSYLQSIMDNRAVGNELNQLSWGVLTFEDLRYPLLTSDRPIVMSNGLRVRDAHLVLPISPTAIFVAEREPDSPNAVRKLAKTVNLAEGLNNLIVRQARKYVWGTNDRQLRFVTNRFGERWVSTPLE